jgi:cell division protease FtsH
MLSPEADPVRKVSIIPRGSALGITLSTPEADRFNYSKQHLDAMIKVAIGGRAAEEIVFGDMTTGAEGDIGQVTRIARFMIGRWGMSARIGMVAVLPDQDQPMGSDGFSLKTRELVDEEVLRVVAEAYDAVVALLQDERPRLDALAGALLERETLDQADAYEVAGIPDVGEPSATTPAAVRP